MYIDAHCHLTGGEFDEMGGVGGALARAREKGVGRVICSGYDLSSSLAAKNLSEENEDVYFCAGFHPSEVDGCTEEDLEELRALCRHEKCVAVGEIGLDYHFEDNPAPQRQREFFIRQLRLAEELALPVVIHSRDAAQETLALLRENQTLLKKGGLMHCYAYSLEMMKEFAALGLYFSFGGTSTFKNAKKVQECAKAVPAQRILSETDCPYLTPAPFRGVFPNEPKNIKYIVENLAFLRGEKEEELKAQILQNAKRLFFRLK